MCHGEPRPIDLVVLRSRPLRVYTVEAAFGRDVALTLPAIHRAEEAIHFLDDVRSPSERTSDERIAVIVELLKWSRDNLVSFPINDDPTAPRSHGIPQVLVNSFATICEKIQREFFVQALGDEARL